MQYVLSSAVSLCASASSAIQKLSIVITIITFLQCIEHQFSNHQRPELDNGVRAVDLFQTTFLPYSVQFQHYEDSDTFSSHWVILVYPDPSNSDM